MSKIQECKVFEFAKDGYLYTVKAKTKQQAQKFLLDEHHIDIKNCIDIPESEWDKPTIQIHEDNDTEKEPFYISLRAAFSELEVELLCTNDRDIIE